MTADSADLLQVAISGGDLEELDFLLGAGVKVNAMFESGTYPINLALSLGREDVAARLIDVGASINVEDSFRVDECCRRPIHYAAAANCLMIVKRLIGMGVPIDLQDFGGSTPLHLAAVNGHLDCVRYLLEHNANLHHCSKSGRTAFWKAVQHDRQQVARYLADAGADVNVRNKLEMTVLFDTVRMNLLKMATELIKGGIDMHARDMVGDTALHYGSSLGRLAAVDVLLQYGADVDAVNDNGNTPLFYAVQLDQYDTAISLLNHGANYIVPNRASQTPMHVAMLKEHERSCHLLYHVGARLTGREHAMFQDFETSPSDSKRLFFERLSQVINSPLPLMSLCRVVLRGHAKPTPLALLELPIPITIKGFLLLGDLSATSFI